jgi:magnesium transporter
LDEILNIYFEVLDDIENRIDQIEDKVVKTPKIDIVEKIFETKKTLIYFTKTMGANREVSASVEKEYLSEIDKKRARQFRTLYNDTVQLVDMSSTYRDILTGTLDTYLSSISNNLNKIMKTLTVGASFILIPTLIASIYGMNFRAMPELYWKYGYIFSFGLMILSVSATYIFFKKKKWI